MPFKPPPYIKALAADSARQEARRRQQQEAEVAERARRLCRNGRCDIGTAAGPSEEPEEETEAPPPIPRAPRAVLRKRKASGAAAPASRLPFDVYHPREEAQFLGNRRARERARQWLARASLDLLQPEAAARRRPLEKAALLLYGPSGTGKSAWARFLVEARGLSVSSFSMADHGGREHEKLDHWLGTQPSHDLKGRLNVIVLEDVEELLRICPSARRVRPRCPVILTAGNDLDASALRRGCDEALFFAPLWPQDAARVVRRVAPEATAAQVQLAVDCAAGDIRQLQLIAASKLWELPGGVELSGNRAYDRARKVLQEARRPPGHRGEELCLEEDCFSLAPIVHYNFPRLCEPDAAFVEHVAAFLSDAACFDAARCLHLLPLACRGRGLREPRGALQPPPPASYASSAPPASQRRAREAKDGAEAPTGAYAEPPQWVERKHRFRPGDGLAAGLLAGKLGARGLEALGKAEHRSGEPFAKAYLSRACMLSAQGAEELLEFSARVQRTLGGGAQSELGSGWSPDWRPYPSLGEEDI
jgi:hypothetical protein